jgi:hypothetical protein
VNGTDKKKKMIGHKRIIGIGIADNIIVSGKGTNRGNIVDRTELVKKIGTGTTEGIIKIRIIEILGM